MSQVLAHHSPLCDMLRLIQYSAFLYVWVFYYQRKGMGVREGGDGARRMGRRERESLALVQGMQLMIFRSS